MLRLFAVIFLAQVSVACATYQSNVSGPRGRLASNPESAATEFKNLADKNANDRLVYILDHAMALQVAGQFKESSLAFNEADKFAELQDYTSISKETLSLLTSEEMVQYKGDDYEKLFINVFAAINFLLLNDFESANVETRRLNEKLNFFRTEEKNYEPNPFAIYLNGHIWESNKNWDSALIDFEKAFQLGINNKFIQEDLLRAAARAGRRDKLTQYQNQFNLKPSPAMQNKKNGELILIYQQGWGPRKAPRPESPRFPMLVPEYSTTQKARLSVSGFESVETEKFFDVEGVAIRTLDSQMGMLIAKRMAGIVAKETVAHQMAKENETLGAVLKIAMHVSDRADLRQWSTLPQSIQLARVYLPPGEHEMSIEGLTASGSATGEAKSNLKVNIRSQKKTFIFWRSYQ